MQDFTISTNQGRGQMAFNAGPSLFNNLYLSLEIAKGTLFIAPNFGMLRRPRLKNNDAAARLIRSDIFSALQWLFDCDRVKSVSVDMERDTLYDKCRLKARVTVTAADGTILTYDKFVEVV